MASNNPGDFQLIQEKVTAYLKLHRRIVEDFERSLANSRHFIDLARISMEREANDTMVMLEQIKEIDLVHHLTTQYDAFMEILEVLPGEQAQELSEEKIRELNQLAEQYQSLLDEADDQQENIEKVIFTIQNPH